MDEKRTEKKQLEEKEAAALLANGDQNEAKQSAQKKQQLLLNQTSQNDLSIVSESSCLLKKQSLSVESRNNEGTPPLLQSYSSSVSILKIMTWFWCCVYATFIVVYYTTTWCNNNLQAWNYVDDPTMYVEANNGENIAEQVSLSPSSFLVSLSSMLHQSQTYLWMIFGPGAYLLVIGPLQFVPSLRYNNQDSVDLYDQQQQQQQTNPFDHRRRRRNNSIHAKLGRIALLANLSTAVGGIAYLVLMKFDETFYPTLTSHANFATFVFGISVLICTIQTYRYSTAFGSEYSFKQQHKQWAYRLTALQLGNLLYRLYVTTFKTLLNMSLMGGSQTTTTTGPTMTSLYSSLLGWSFFVPNLVFVEWYIRSESMKNSNDDDKNKLQGGNHESKTGVKSSSSQHHNQQKRFSSSSESSTDNHWYKSFILRLAWMLLFAMGVLTTVTLWIPGIIWCLSGTSSSNINDYDSYGWNSRPNESQ